MQHIPECRALHDVLAGRIETAISKCRNIWASLPGAGYGHREINELLSRGAFVLRSFGLLKGAMDRRLAGLSFLLTLGWVTAVAFVMWYFVEP